MEEYVNNKMCSCEKSPETENVVEVKQNELIGEIERKITEELRERFKHKE